MANRHDALSTLLRDLRLATIADRFSDYALKATKEGLTHEEFLYELALAENEARQRRRYERLLGQSNLPREKTFASLRLDAFGLLTRQLISRMRSGAFLERAANLVLVGKPGAGKTHLAAAIGHELVERGIPVLFTSTYALMQRLLAAKRDLRLPQEMARLDRYELLILDDIGYVQQDREEMEVLFTLLAERYERKSVAITTNLVFSEWERIFKDPMTTMAAIDRVVHRSIILDLMAVPSYRAKEAKTDYTENAPTPEPDAAGA